MNRLFLISAIIPALLLSLSISAQTNTDTQNTQQIREPVKIIVVRDGQIEDSYVDTTFNTMMKDKSPVRCDDVRYKAFFDRRKNRNTYNRSQEKKGTGNSETENFDAQ